MIDATARPTALLFPGQGSQTENMRAGVLRACPELDALACELVGEDPFARVEESTRFAQPAIFCASVAAWRELDLDGRPVVAAAGHSLGELAALTAAGVLDAEEALRAVVVRGAAMAAAGDTGEMIALVGGAPWQAQGIAEGAGVIVANDNAPGQAVLSGPHDRMQAAADAAEAAGLRAMRLPVAGAFHSPAMAPAAAAFEAALAAVHLREGAFPVYSCASARPFVDVRAELVAALTAPVRWRETVLSLAQVAEDFVEPGPGKVLSRLVKRIVARRELAHVR